MNVLASRDVSYDSEGITSIMDIVESTPFHCKVLVHPQQRVGLIRIEYEGHSEQEIRECDLKLTAKMINIFEAKGGRNLILFPLEFS